MQQYLMGVWHPEIGPDAPAPEQIAAIMRDVDALNGELRTAGAWVFAGGLRPAATASVVRVEDDRAVVTDGPFAQGTDHVGGFWVISAPDRDTALRWAEKATRACQAPIELRPFHEEPEG